MVNILKISACAFAMAFSFNSFGFEPMLIANKRDLISVNPVNDQIFSRKGNVITAFDINSKKAFSLECDFDYSQTPYEMKSVEFVSDDIYTIFAETTRPYGDNRYDNAIFIYKRGAFCKRYETYQTDIKVAPANNKIYVALPEYLSSGNYFEVYVLDSRTGATIDKLDVHEYQLIRDIANFNMKVIGNNLYIIGEPAPDSTFRKILVYDLKAKGVVQNISLPSHFMKFLTPVDIESGEQTKLFFISDLNQIYLVDLVQIDENFDEIYGTIDPNCDLPTFYSKNNILICRKDLPSGYINFYQKLDNSAAIYPWGNTPYGRVVYSPKYDQLLWLKAAWGTEMQVVNIQSGTIKEVSVNDGPVAEIFASQDGDFYAASSAKLWKVSEDRTMTAVSDFSDLSSSIFQNYGYKVGYFSGTKIYTAYNMVDNQYYFFDVP